MCKQNGQRNTTWGGRFGATGFRSLNGGKGPLRRSDARRNRKKDWLGGTSFGAGVTALRNASEAGAGPLQQSTFGMGSWTAVIAGVGFLDTLCIYFNPIRNESSTTHYMK